MKVQRGFPFDILEKRSNTMKNTTATTQQDTINTLARKATLGTLKLIHANSGLQLIGDLHRQALSDFHRTKDIKSLKSK